MKTILKPDFFDRPALVVARDLLGKYLVRELPDPSTKPGIKAVAFMITETEAYFGFKDQGSHAHRGKTPRNTPMFGEAGTIYVYFTYGMHWMLNVVCGKKDFPAAVLIRSAGGVVGPARLTKALSIEKSLNSKKLGKASGVWIEDRGVKISPKKIKKTPRIGISNRGVWTNKRWRFVLENKTGENRNPHP
ncbi:MAG: DNA-3-methyladenine glycosylase [Patescibacteria group bacterium]|nr:DNA-3-methyladenine glycosylase [Patescibacteria group bacterium]